MTRAGKITRDQVIAEALALVDEEGLSALTARSLATRLGLRNQGALYHHIGSMDDVLIEIVWATIQPVTQVSSEGLTWQTFALRRAKILRSCLLAHPNVLPVLVGVLGRQALLSRADGALWWETAGLLNLMAEDGIVGLDALLVFESLEALTIGSATIGSPQLVLGSNSEGIPPEGQHLVDMLSTRSMSAEERFELEVVCLLDGLVQRIQRVAPKASVGSRRATRLK